MEAYSVILAASLLIPPVFCERGLPSSPEVFYGGFVPMWVQTKADSMFSENRNIERKSKSLDIDRSYKKSELKNRKPNRNTIAKKEHAKDKKLLLHKDSIPTFPLCKVSKLIVFFLSYFCFRYTWETQVYISRCHHQSLRGEWNSQQLCWRQPSVWAVQHLQLPAECEAAQDPPPGQHDQEAPGPTSPSPCPCICVLLPTVLPQPSCTCPPEQQCPQSRVCP